MAQPDRDWELLREYLDRGSEQAFAQLVAAHVDMVYSAALRQVRDHDLAEEVAQIVFVVLARKARSLRSGTILSAWLLRTTRYTALNVLKTQKRRVAHERKAAEMACETVPADSTWKWLSPILDEGIAHLSQRDRQVISLRFFQHKSMAETGQALGISEEAASMRVWRAVDRLRTFFARRGVTLSAAALGGIIWANSVQAAPTSAGQSIASNTLRILHGLAPDSAATLSAANSVTRAMALARAKAISLAIAATLAAAVILGFLTNRTAQLLLQESPPPGERQTP